MTDLRGETAIVFVVEPESVPWVREAVFASPSPTAPPWIAPDWTLVAYAVVRRRRPGHRHEPRRYWFRKGSEATYRPGDWPLGARAPLAIRPRVPSVALPRPASRGEA